MANYCYFKKAHEASTTPSNDFVQEEVTTSKEKKVTEAFVIAKINNKKVKVKLDTGAEVNVMLLRICKQIETEAVQMRKIATKLCGYGGTNIPVIGKITMKCKLRDAKEQLEFYIVIIDSERVLSLQIWKLLRIMQILNEVKSQKQYDEIEDKMYHQINRGIESEVI